MPSSGLPKLLLRLRLPVLVAVLLLTAVLGAGWRHLGFGYSVESFLRTEDPELRAAVEHYRDFPFPDNLLLFGFEHPDPLGDEALDTLADLSRRLQAVAGVDRVLSLATLPDPRLRRHDRLRETLATSRLYRRLFHAEARAGRPGALGGLIQLERDARDGHERKALLDRIRAAGEGAGVTLVLSGVPFLREQYVELVKADQRLFLPLTTAVTLCLLFWLVPGVGLALATVSIVPLTLLWTFGGLGWLGAELTLLTSTLFTLLMVIAVADAVHIVLRYKQERLAGLDREAAGARALEHTAAPCALTSLTTIVGFGSLMLASIPDLREFGAWASLGVAIAFVLTLVVVPTATPLLGRLLGEGGDRLRGALWFGKASRRLASLPPGRVLVGFALATGLAVALAMQVRQDSYMLEDLDPRSEPYRDFKWFEDHFAGSTTSEVLVTFEDGDAFDPATLAELRGVIGRIEQRDFVRRTLSYVDAVDDGLPRPIVRALDAPPFGFFAADGRSARVLVFMGDIGTRAAEEWFAWVRGLDDGLAHVRVRPVGLHLLATRQVTRLVEEVEGSFLLAFVVILMVMTLAFRSLRYGVLAMIPNLFPTLITLGFMGVVGINLRIVSVISFAIAFGLAVDNTIHILSRYQRERARGTAPDEAVRVAAGAVGSAVWTTSLLLLLGFTILTWSRFKASQDFGLLACVTIASALVGDLLLLPALLRHFDRRRDRARDAAMPPGGPRT
ncbi:MAG: efflux RND transporter permease subunit [Planctomycetota bacterium]